MPADGPDQVRTNRRTAFFVITVVTTTSTGVLHPPGLRNSDRGYGPVSKTLHWLTVLAVLAQFVVGYWMSRVGDQAGGIALLPVHVGLGLGILALTVVRLVWRLATPLPPWAEQLSAVERTIARAVERTLYLLLFLIPLTGLGLLLIPGPGDLLLGLHIAAHIAFFATLTVHLVLVVKNRLVRRML